jgi:hypothetical protein
MMTGKIIVNMQAKNEMKPNKPDLPL